MNLEMTALDLLGIIAGILTTFSASPQLYYSYTTKDVRSLNLLFMTMLISGLTTWSVYGYFIGSMPIIVFNAIGAALWLPLFLMKLQDIKKRDRHSIAEKKRPQTSRDQSFD